MATGIRAHIKVVQHPNPSVRSFHVTRKIGNIDHMYSFGKESFSLSEPAKDPGEDAKMLAKCLSELHGVTYGSLQSYEVTVGIGDAFSWHDIGPLVLGQIVHSIFPEIDNGKSIEVSASIGWCYHTNWNSVDESGATTHHTRYQDTVDHEPVEVKLGTPPTLDIEHMFDKDALAKAKQQARQEDVLR